MITDEFRQWFADSAADVCIQHFSAHELVIFSSRNGVTNAMPPRRLWGNCIPTISVLDHLRCQIDYPLIITSGYRSKKYNAEVGGAKHSQHLEFRAFDITCNHVSPAKLFDELADMRRQGLWSGGLGVYSTFVHVDTRPGQSRTWGRK